MAQIVLSNANGSGVVSNMRVGEVKEAREVDEHMVISVTRHKTAFTQGPAKIVLTNAVYSWLHISVSKICVHFSQECDNHTEPVFSQPSIYIDG